jgi:hypothetical protein
MKLMKIKIIQESTSVELEKVSNVWLSTQALDAITIVDIKYGFHKDDRGAIHLAYIQYY